MNGANLDEAKSPALEKAKVKIDLVQAHESSSKFAGKDLKKMLDGRNQANKPISDQDFSNNYIDQKNDINSKSAESQRDPDKKRERDEIARSSNPVIHPRVQLQKYVPLYKRQRKPSTATLKRDGTKSRQSKVESPRVHLQVSEQIDEVDADITNIVEKQPSS